MEISDLRQQKIWGRAAAVNFTLGSAGAAYYVIAVVNWWLLPGSGDSAGAVQVTGIAVLLMSVGFFILALESGNAVKGRYALLNFKTSWMSREVILFAIFVFCAFMALLFRSELLKLGAAIAALLFMVSQALIIYKARAIIAWNTSSIPVLFILSGGVGGFAVYMIVHDVLQLSSQIGGAAAVAIVAHLFVWGFYLFFSNVGNRDFRQATAALRGFRSLTITLAVGGLLPLALIALATISRNNEEGPALFAVAGVAMLFGIYIRNSDLILKAGFFRKLELRFPQDSSEGWKK